MGAPQRRLAAIMFTDIVGYSAMMQKDEAITNRLRKRHREVFSRLTKKYDGEILQYYGDGTLSIFYSTAAAVECAVDIQRELKQDPKVPLRIGIHTGDITFSEEDVYGDGVNIASRIESLCVPGGIFVSGKVYDDIKNHHSLRAKSVGAYGLKNIQDNIAVYAITNPGITIPRQGLVQSVKAKPSSKTRRKSNKRHFLKSRKTAAKLAFPFGLFGVHRFYLGQKFYGVLYALFFILGIVEGEALLIVAPPVISFLDMLIFRSMSDEEFDLKYNKGLSSRSLHQSGQIENTRTQDEQLSSQKSFLKAQFERHKSAGLEHFRNYDFQGAIEAFSEANEIKYDDADVHFLLARAYSMTEDAQNALTHLDAAVAFGLNVYQIKLADDLAFLRLQPEFKEFEKSNYRLLEKRKPIARKKADSPETFAPSKDFLEQLKKLNELREKGYLTEEEFIKQKERLR